MDPVSAALPQNLRRIFVATLQQDFFDDIGPDGVSSPRHGQDDDSLEPVINTSKLNPKNMDEQRLEGALYFIIKSYSIEDVMISIKDGVWNSTDQVKMIEYVVFDFCHEVTN